jgi:transposase InsO family protein
VQTWSGTVYVAFVIDVFARRIVGWRASTSMKTQFVNGRVKVSQRAAQNVATLGLG